MRRIAFLNGPPIATYYKEGQTICVSESGAMWCEFSATKKNPDVRPYGYLMTSRYEGPETHKGLKASGYVEADDLTDEDLGL